MPSTHSASNSFFDNDRVKIQDSGPYRCPCCPVRLPRVEFVKHLWLEHRLVLDGQEVRDPWRLIADWAKEYSRSRDPELLRRCQAFGTRLDPEQGTLRVHGVLLAQGIDDERARQALLAEAGKRRVSICPRCFTFVHAPEEVPVQPLDLSSGPACAETEKNNQPLASSPVRRFSISQNGYRTEIDEEGLFPRLAIETPGQSIYQGAEPGRLLTWAGAAFFLAGPLILGALLLALLSSPGGGSPLLPVMFLLLCSLVVFFLARWSWSTGKKWLNRAIDYAWTILVPRLEANGYTPDDFAFLASLALTSMGRGRSKLRAAILDRLIHRAEKAVATDTVPMTHLAALCRLAVEDKAEMGTEAVSPDLPAKFYACPGCGRELCPRTGELALLREEMEHENTKD